MLAKMKKLCLMGSGILLKSSQTQNSLGRRFQGKFEKNSKIEGFAQSNFSFQLKFQVAVTVLNIMYWALESRVFLCLHNNIFMQKRASYSYTIVSLPKSILFLLVVQVEMYWLQHSVMLIIPLYLLLQGYPYTLEEFAQARHFLTRGADCGATPPPLLVQVSLFSVFWRRLKLNCYTCK